MSAPTLSICIPTHHGRSRELSQALASVTGQLTDELRGRVQVVVSDNGSADETRAVVERVREELGDGLVYHRFEENVGFTRNLLRVVEVADGGHCWLLGSDDALAEGALRAVLDGLDRHPGLTGVTVNRLNVDAVSGEAVLDDPKILPAARDEALYETPEAILSELGILQDFISTQVVARDRWLAAVAELGPEGIAIGRSFPHLPILIAMIRSAPCWLWLPAPLLLHRVGRATLGAFGSSMAEHGMLVTAERSGVWARMLGRGTPVYRTLNRRGWLLQASPFAIATYKNEPDHDAARTRRLLVTLTRWYGDLPEYWLRSVPILLLPRPLMHLAGRAHRELLRRRGITPGVPADGVAHPPVGVFRDAARSAS